MGNLINFMERLGASAELQELSETEVLSILQQQHFKVGSENSLHQEVEKILDVRKNLICGVMAAEEDSDDTEVAA